MSPKPSDSPSWATTTYDTAFKVGSNEDLAEAISDYRGMNQADRDFYQAHLTYRVVQGLAAVASVLRRVDAETNENLVAIKDVLSAVGGAQVLTNKHLVTLRKKLDELIELSEYENDADEPDDDTPRIERADDEAGNVSTHQPSRIRPELLETAGEAE